MDMDLREMADLYEQVQAAQRLKMGSLKIAVNPTDEPQMRAMLDDAGYDPIETVPSRFVEPGTMFIIDLDLVPPPPWEPEPLNWWDELRGRVAKYTKGGGGSGQEHN